MKIIFLYCITAFTFLSLCPILTFAQCSDAGICQVGHLMDDGKEQYLTFSVSYKNGYSGKKENVSFHSLQLDTHYDLFKSSTIGFMIPYNIQSGTGRNVSGIGDLLISWTQKLFSDKTSLISASVGFKLSTGDENIEPGLPQVYQPGLGSNDFIFAIDYNHNKFGIGLGYQLAGGRNDKDGVKLKRGDDLLVRTSYVFSFMNFSVVPQLLLIKRLSKSSVLNLNSPYESFIEVEKSDQTQLNFLTYLQYNLNESYALFTEIAFPFIKREINVDGLTRAYTISAGLRFIIN